MRSAAGTAASHAVTRRTLIVVELVLALNAIAGAVYAFGGAEGVEREWLDGTPFNDYVIPGVILLVVVGGSLAAAAVALLRRVPTAWEFSVAAGAVVLGWITALAIRLKLAGEREA
jgi:hypothetical protein